MSFLCLLAETWMRVTDRSSTGKSPPCRSSRCVYEGWSTAVYVELPAPIFFPIYILLKTVRQCIIRAELDTTAWEERLRIQARVQGPLIPSFSEGTPILKKPTCYDFFISRLSWSCEGGSLTYRAVLCNITLTKVNPNYIHKIM